MNVFGSSIDGTDVERALLEHLQAWMPTMVAEVRRQKDPEPDPEDEDAPAQRWPENVAAIRSYTVVHAANEKWPEDQLPMLLAFCPGLAEAPQAEGDGRVRARFAVTLTAIASGFNMDDSKELARLYASAARLAILQHESLGDFADGVEWLDMRNFEVTRGVEAERNLMAVSDIYAIDVAQVLDRMGGPIEPSVDPEVEPEDWPTVEEGGGAADVTITTS